jgi:hypothetical protein
MAIAFHCCRHLKRLHPDAYKKYGASVQSHLPIGDAATAGSGIQCLMTSFTNADHNVTYGLSNPRQRVLTMSLVTNLIIKCGLPISLVDNDDFRDFLHTLDPKFKVPCRQTVTSSLLPAVKKSVSSKVQVFLDRSCDVALTTDIWSDRRCHSYLAVTVHAFVDGSPRSMLLAFKALSGSHTGERISECIENIISEHHIQHKIRCIVSDNASNMRKAMSVLLESETMTESNDNDEPTVEGGADLEVDDPSLWEDVPDVDLASTVSNDTEHLTCFAHSLQLVVKDGLERISSGRPFLSKCCKISNLVHQSPLFRSAYECIMGPGKSIPASNDTRWNSTFMQLKAIAKLDQAELVKVLQESKHENLILTTKDLSQLNQLVQLLAPFPEATDLTQGQSIVTISCVIPVVLSLTAHLQNMLQLSNSLTAVATTLLRSLHWRFAGVFRLLGISQSQLSAGRHHANDLKFDSNLFLIAPALDPCYAYHWLADVPASTEAREAIRCKVNG